MHMVFVHGWGFDASFWQPLIAALGPQSHEVVELGFLGAEPSYAAYPDGVYVTHSLGAMWALKKASDTMHGLIAINGFSCFKKFTNQRTLRAMKARLHKEPDAQIRDFWALCGNAPEYKSLNIERLEEGLLWLSHWDEKETLATLNVPVLSLAGDKDQVCPLNHMKKHWQAFDLSIIAGAGHVLPLTHTDIVKAKIQGFMDEL